MTECQDFEFHDPIDWSLWELRRDDAPETPGVIPFYKPSGTRWFMYPKWITTGKGIVPSFRSPDKAIQWVLDGGQPVMESE